MSARRLLRILTRPVKRLLRPWRLRHLDYLAAYSDQEIDRLRMMRADIVALEQNEHKYQVHLSMRRSAIERG